MWFDPEDPAKLMSEIDTIAEIEIEKLDPYYVIDGYGQYQSGARHKDVLWLVRDALSTLVTRRPVSMILVEGHADIDIAQPNERLRRRKERTVSFDRAEQMYHDMVDTFYDELPNYMNIHRKLPKWGYCGRGIDKLRHEKPRSEFERRQNRRTNVYFEYKEYPELKFEEISARCRHGAPIVRVLPPHLSEFDRAPHRDDNWEVKGCNFLAQARRVKLTPDDWNPSDLGPLGQSMTTVLVPDPCVEVKWFRIRDEKNGFIQGDDVGEVRNDMKNNFPIIKDARFEQVRVESNWKPDEQKEEDPPYFSTATAY